MIVFSSRRRLDTFVWFGVHISLVFFFFSCVGRFEVDVYHHVTEHDAPVEVAQHHGAAGGYQRLTGYRSSGTDVTERTWLRKGLGEWNRGIFDKPRNLPAVSI